MYKLLFLLLFKIHCYSPAVQNNCSAKHFWVSMTNTRPVFHIVYTLESTWMVRIMCDHGSVSWYFLGVGVEGGEGADGTDSTLTLNSDLQSRDGSLTRSQLFHCLLPIVQSLPAFSREMPILQSMKLRSPEARNEKYMLVKFISVYLSTGNGR